MAYQTLLLPPGIERNATPYDTPGRWWDMNLVRWQGGSLRPVGGWMRVGSSALDSHGRIIHVYRDNVNARHIIIGTDNKLYADSGGTFYDVTPGSFVPLGVSTGVGGYGTGDFGEYSYGTARPNAPTIFQPATFWSAANWGEDVIVCASSDGRLLYYGTSNPTTAPLAISGAPVGNKSVVVTNERHVMAIGCGNFPRRVGWSSREDRNDWDFTSTTNTAGYLDLDARTPLIKGVRVREGVLIFSQSEAFLARYVGVPYIYGIDRIADTSLMSPMAVATFNGKAAWMGNAGFYKYDGGFITPLNCPITKDVYSNISSDFGKYRTHAVHNGVFPEIWWFYPTAGNEEANRYVVYNYAEDFWYWGELSRTAASPAEAYEYPYMCGNDKIIYEHETGYTDAGKSRVGSIFVETGMLPLTDGSRGVVVNNVLPANGDGYQSLNIKFFSRMAPEGTERTFGPYNPRSTGYTDCRVSGRDIRLRIQATKDEDWSIGKLRFNVEQGTGR